MGNSGNERMHSNNSGHAKSVMRHGMWGWRIIKTEIRNGREWQLHATKGWRSRRALAKGQ